MNIINTMKEVNDEVIKNLKEGTECENINQIATRIYKDSGYFEFVRHRIGHGMGFEGHEAPWLSPGDKTILKKYDFFK